MSTLAKRIKSARLKAGLSQEQLGIEAGLEPASASARMNRYELGKRVPDLLLMESIAKVLKVPAPYFYAADDQVAELVVSFSRLKKNDKAKVLQMLQELSH